MSMNEDNKQNSRIKSKWTC